MFIFLYYYSLCSQLEIFPKYSRLPGNEVWLGRFHNRPRAIWDLMFAVNYWHEDWIAYIIFLYYYMVYNIVKIPDSFRSLRSTANRHHQPDLELTFPVWNQTELRKPQTICMFLYKTSTVTFPKRQISKFWDYLLKRKSEFWWTSKPSTCIT